MNRSLWGGYKIITGEVIHQQFLANCCYRSICAEWDGLSRGQREMYDKVAHALNVWLEQEDNENDSVQSGRSGLLPA